MRRYAAYITLWSLIAISVLGFFAMHNAGPCFTETVSRATCPEGVFAAIDFHVSAWQNISLATLEASIAAAAALLFLGLIGFAWAMRPSVSFRPLRLEMAPVFIPSFAAELRWLAFHLNSPNRA